MVNEQNKVEIALGRLDRELNNLSDIHLKRFGFEHESKDDIKSRISWQIFEVNNKSEAH